MVNLPIAVGVDGSPSARDAVRWAAREAVMRGAPLLLLSSVSVGGIVGVGIPASFFDELREAGERVVAEAVMLAQAEDPEGKLAVRTELSSRTAVEALLEHSRSAHMVVLGTRGLGEATRGLVGSVTSAVARHAHCPVAVITGLPRPGERDLEGPIVVGVDGSANSEPAVALAFEEASLRGAPLVAIHAWSDRDLSAIFAGKTLPWGARETAEQAVLAESLAGWREKYPDVVVHQIVVQDRPARNLIMRGGGARLIVVGSRGRGGFKGMLLGSTSAAVLHTATCPLLIVRQSQVH